MTKSQRRPSSFILSAALTTLCLSLFGCATDSAYQELPNSAVSTASLPSPSTTTATLRTSPATTQPPQHLVPTSAAQAQPTPPAAPASTTTDTPFQPPDVTGFTAFPNLFFIAPTETIGFTVEVTSGQPVSYVRFRFEDPTATRGLAGGEIGATLISGTPTEGKWSASYTADCHDYPPGSAIYVFPEAGDQDGNTGGEPQQIVRAVYSTAVHCG